MGSRQHRKRLTGLQRESNQEKKLYIVLTSSIEGSERNTTHKEGQQKEA